MTQKFKFVLHAVGFGGLFKQLPPLALDSHSTQFKQKPKKKYFIFKFLLTPVEL